MSLPAGLRSLFWDVNITTFDPTAHPTFAVERVLERGDQAAARWLRDTFPEEIITEVLRGSHRLSARSATFWALVFNVPRDEVKVLSESHER
jgi:hypothetical protein